MWCFSNWFCGFLGEGEERALRILSICSEREEGKTGREEWNKAWSCGKQRCIAAKPTNNSAPMWFLSVQPWSISEGACRAPHPPDFQARGGTLQRRSHLMGGPGLTLSLEHWEEPACGAALCLPRRLGLLARGERHRHACWPHCCSRTALPPGPWAKGRRPTSAPTRLVSQWLHESVLHLTRVMGSERLYVEGCPLPGLTWLEWEVFLLGAGWCQDLGPCSPREGRVGLGGAETLTLVVQWVTGNMSQLYFTPSCSPTSSLKHISLAFLFFSLLIFWLDKYLLSTDS